MSIGKRTSAALILSATLVACGPDPVVVSLDMSVDCANADALLACLKSLTIRVLAGEKVTADRCLEGEALTKTLQGSSRVITDQLPDSGEILIQVAGHGCIGELEAPCTVPDELLLLSGETRVEAEKAEAGVTVPIVCASSCPSCAPPAVCVPAAAGPTCQSLRDPGSCSSDQDCVDGAGTCFGDFCELPPGALCTTCGIPLECALGMCVENLAFMEPRFCTRSCRPYDSDPGCPQTVLTNCAILSPDGWRILE